MNCDEPPPPTESIAVRIRRVRELRKRSLAWVARKGGISKAYLWEIEKRSGRAENPTIAVVERIARALDVDPAWLAGWPRLCAPSRILDYEPQLVEDEFGPERSIRWLVHNYYGQHLSSEKALETADAYVAAITALLSDSESQPRAGKGEAG